MKFAIAMVIGMAAGLAAPVSAATFSKFDLDCFDNGSGGESCVIDYPMFFPDFVPPLGRNRITIATNGIPLSAAGAFAPEYHWDFYALDGSLTLGNNSLGAFGSFASFNGQTSGFMSDLLVTPFAISFTADVPANTDRCANLYAQYGTAGYVCTEVFEGVETISASLGFTNPPDSFAVTVTTQPLTGPGGTVPEPASWALLLTGFGLTGAVLRRRRAICAS